MKRNIFISYRRDDDCGLAAGWLADRLQSRKWDVFMDLKIPPGANWRKTIETAVSKCNLMLVAIGSKWFDLLKTKQTDNHRDWVRTEISVALQRDIPLVPILIGTGVQMPILTEYADIRDIMDREARTFDPSSAKAFSAQAEQFAEELQEYYGGDAAVAPAKAAPPIPQPEPLGTGRWTIEKWINKRGEGRIGSLQILRRLDSGKLLGLMHISPANDPKRVIEQEVSITVAGSTVTMAGKVVKGTWLDDHFTFQHSGDRLVGGCIDKNGVNAEVVLRRIDS
jgi:TIR domain